MKRLSQFILIASTIALSWLGMMIVHEAGHVAGAWMSGGTVSKVVLNPLTFSRTDLSYNPHPLFVVWCGPIIGVLLPVAVWRIAVVMKAPGAYLWRFFVGFCLLANGVYLGIGSFDGIGDAGDLAAFGAADWQLWLFGAATAPLGIFLWHGLGPKFGLGASRGRVSYSIAYSVLGLLILVILAECVISLG